MENSSEDLNDLEIEKKAISDMNSAVLNISAAINQLSSALSLRCFAKHRIENKEDIDNLSDSLDALIGIKEKIQDILEPYFIFHEIDSTNLNEWLINPEEPYEDYDIEDRKRYC